MIRRLGVPEKLLRPLLPALESKYPPKISILRRSALLACSESVARQAPWAS
jgi:hypothetical protein